MPEDENAPVVEGEYDENFPVVEGADVMDPVVEDDGTEGDAGGTHKETPAESFANLRKSKEESERLAREREIENRLLREELQAHRSKGSSQAPQSIPAEDDLSDFGIDFDDVVDAEPLKNLAKNFKSQTKKINERLSSWESRLEERELSSRDSAYMDTINKYLPKVLAEDPDIKDIIRKAPPSKQLSMMYKFAKTSDEYMHDRVVTTETQAKSVVSKRAVPGAKLPGSSTPGSVNKVDVFSMSDEEFDAHMEKIRRG